MKQKILFLFIIIFMVILVCFPSLAMEGTKNGIILWYESIVPTLLPYMMLTNILIKTDVLKNISSDNKFISANTFLSMFVGFFCGYPMGAHYVSGNYRAGNISKSNAYWLISFINICSPAFIIQYVVLNNLNKQFLIPMIVSIYLSAVLYGIITMPYYLKKHNKEKNIIEKKNVYVNSDASEPIISAMMQALKLLAYIILFSIILNMVTALINTVTISHIIVIGILEITNGIAFASKNTDNIYITALMIAAFTAFGSISCIFQTKSVLKDSNLSIMPYILAKLIQSIFSLIIMYILLK